MPKPKELGTVIAKREMVFVFEDGKREKASLKVGAPFEYGEGFEWCCPYELSTDSSKKLFGMFGVDSMQALQLTLKTLAVEIEYWEKSKKGKFYFLNEEGAAI